ncbi:hypothetical protein Gotri_007977 [Gossypium trilobum]|uniref:CCHC-type domain-containing protein n=1 Tax=Gossypium trilobum TaxID=34281 RepID=A0A7J9EHZ5_9ROSI|nr:hypothetical protein [Gossypium trilobum]
MKPYSSVVKAWIKFPGLSDFLYKWRILEETDGTTGKMLINGTIQRVEFESLSMVRFSCGRYGHVRKMCPKKATETSQSEVKVLTVANENLVGDLVAYGPWMVINRKSRWSSRLSCSQQAFVLGSEGMTLDLGLYLSALIVAISGGPSGMDVPLKEGVLDPSKHLTISFKEKLTAVEGKALKVNNLIKLVKGIHLGRGRGNGGKNDSNRNGKFLNMTLRGHGERSKASGNSCFPLSDTMNSMAELISSQIDIVGDTRAQSRNEKGLESLSSAK